MIHFLTVVACLAWLVVAGLTFFAFWNDFAARIPYYLAFLRALYALGGTVVVAIIAGVSSPFLDAFLRTNASPRVMLYTVAWAAVVNVLLLVLYTRIDYYQRKK